MLFDHIDTEYVRQYIPFIFYLGINSNGGALYFGLVRSWDFGELTVWTIIYGIFLFCNDDNFCNNSVFT